jgi:hypothetical protein
MSLTKTIKLSLVALIASFGALAVMTSRSALATAVYCPESNKVTSSPMVIANSQATVTFTVAAGCHDIQLSLVSYKAPSATFSRDTASQQTVFDSKTDNFSAGEHTWSVNLPDCFYQADFVYGTVIEHLGPANSNNFYSDQGRLITGSNGGTKTCETGGMGGGLPTPPPTTGGQGGGTTTSTTPQVAVAPAGSVNAGRGTQTFSLASVAGLTASLSLAGLGARQLRKNL